MPAEEVIAQRNEEKKIIKTLINLIMHPPTGQKLAQNYHNLSFLSMNINPLLIPEFSQPTGINGYLCI
jgi:hypothetical protein